MSDIRERLYKAVTEEIQKITDADRTSAIVRGLEKTIASQARKINRQAHAFNEAQRRIGWLKANKCIPRPINWTRENRDWVGRVGESVYYLWGDTQLSAWNFNGERYGTAYEAKAAAWEYHLDVLKELME